MQMLMALAHRFWGPFSLFLLATAGVIGLVALVNPRWFEQIVAHGDRWVDTEKLFAVFDKRVNVDRYVLPYSRLFGALIVAVVVLIGLLFSPVRMIR